MSTPTTGRRQRGSTRTYTAEDQALNQIAKEAESRLAAKRSARAEAREIRMKELEKQQKESEQMQDKQFERRNVHTSTNRMIQNVPTSYKTTRRGSDDSNASDSREDQRELKSVMAELEEKYKRAMINSSQLDNEKQALTYQVELLKDKVEEMEEALIEIQRECKDRTRELEHERHTNKDLSHDLEIHKEIIQIREKLIEEHGFVLVGGEVDTDTVVQPPALVSSKGAKILEEAGVGSLDERLKKLQEDKENLSEKVKQLQLDLENERDKYSDYSPGKSGLQPTINGPDAGMQLLDIQREATRQINEYKLKLQKAEQDITTLEGNGFRLETQLKRYKTQAESSEKIEDELKAEKRKLQRELREAMSTVEEVQNQNNHLQKRLEKIKSARNALATK